MDQKVKFYEKGSGHATFFTQDGVYLNLTRGSSPAVGDLFGKSGLSPGASPLDHALQEQKQEPRSSFIKLTPVGANKHPKIVAEGVQEGKVNYFVGNDPKKWKTNIPTYQAVVYKEIYPGIDIKFYENNRQMEYDIIVKPGADPSKVQLAYEGIEGLKVTDDGNLEIGLKEGKIIQKKPVIFQEINGKRVNLDGRFSIQNHSYSFEVAAYNKSHSLIIDPTLIYSTYLGGSSNTYGQSITVDGSGNAYVTGWASTADFPTTPGAYDTTFNGVFDVFVVKLNPTGSALSYATLGEVVMIIALVLPWMAPEMPMSQEIPCPRISRPLPGSTIQL